MGVNKLELIEVLDMLKEIDGKVLMHSFGTRAGRDPPYHAEASNRLMVWLSLSVMPPNLKYLKTCTLSC